MITLNGKKFAATDSEFVNSLFDAGGSCAGYYRREAGQVFLLNMQKERVGVINRAGVMGSATRQPDGNYWYSYATIKEVGEYQSYTQQLEESRAALIAA